MRRALRLGWVDENFCHLCIILFIWHTLLLLFQCLTKVELAPSLPLHGRSVVSIIFEGMQLSVAIPCAVVFGQSWLKSTCDLESYWGGWKDQ